VVFQSLCGAGVVTSLSLNSRVVDNSAGHARNLRNDESHLNMKQILFSSRML